MKFLLAFLITTLFSVDAFALPTFTPQLVLKNQQGETSVNYIAPGTTFIGGKIAANTIPSNLTGASAYPVANTYAAVSAKLTPAMLLTGFVSGAGVIASTDTVLQGFNKAAGNEAALKNGTFTPTVETVIAAGALSTTIMESTVSNITSGTYAVTLAAPSSQDGQVKIIKAIATMTHTVTLAMTNIATSGAYTAAGTTTLTFTNAGDSAVFIAVGGKWVYLGGSAVAS
jgi:hypothetical protein